jgi:hypothetical protein
MFAKQQQQQQLLAWQQFAATAAAKRTTSSLLDDVDQDETVYQHMQLPGVGPRSMTAEDCAFLPSFSMVRSESIGSVESGALPMVPLQRCNHS